MPTSIMTFKLKGLPSDETGHSLFYPSQRRSTRLRPPRYLSNRCVRVELMALSTVAIASTIDVATNGSPFRLTSGTGKT